MGPEYKHHRQDIISFMQEILDIALGQHLVKQRRAVDNSGRARLDGSKMSMARNTGDIKQL